MSIRYCVQLPEFKSRKTGNRLQLGRRVKTNTTDEQPMALPVLSSLITSPLLTRRLFLILSFFFFFLISFPVVSYFRLTPSLLLLPVSFIFSLLSNSSVFSFSFLVLHFFVLFMFFWQFFVHSALRFVLFHRLVLIHFFLVFEFFFFKFLFFELFLFEFFFYVFSFFESFF